MTHSISPREFNPEEFDKWLHQHSHDDTSANPVVRVAQACFNNQVKEVERLVRLNHIDVNLCSGLALNPDGTGYLPSNAIQHACRHGQLSLVQSLVKLGADVNAPNLSDLSKPNLHYPPLEVAYDHNHLNVLKYLIDCKAHVNSLIENQPLVSSIIRRIIYGDRRFFPAALQVLIDQGGEIDYPNEKGLTPLSEALATKTCSRLIRFLIYNGTRIYSIGLEEIVIKANYQKYYASLVTVRSLALKQLSLVRPKLDEFEFLQFLGHDCKNLVHDYLIDTDLLTKDQKKELPRLCLKIEQNSKKKKENALLPSSSL